MRPNYRAIIEALNEGRPFMFTGSLRASQARRWFKCQSGLTSSVKSACESMQHFGKVIGKARRG